VYGKRIRKHVRTKTKGYKNTNITPNEKSVNSIEETVSERNPQVLKPRKKI